MEKSYENLKCNIGRKMKIEYCSNRQIKTVCGVLFDLKDYYILIKRMYPKECIMIEISTIKSIKVLQ